MSNIEPAFFAGCLLAVLALRWAREGYSAWFALLPGTLAHELAHYLVALLTASKPRPLSVALRKTGEGWTLGSVQFEAGLISAGFVALAPLYVLPFAALALALHSPGASMPTALAAGYATTTLVYAAVPSRADWGIAIRYPIGTLLTLGLIGLSIVVQVSKG